ncbi:MAG: hypothetical protein M1812_003682 [Candelaria pacifica]|nr:MAG: hypothetical protein M1812_003682 [Candelaria pacifica]
MLPLSLAYVASVLCFTSLSSSAAIDDESSASILVKRQDGPHCETGYGYPNYGDCETAWAQIPIDDPLTPSVFGSGATPGATLVSTPWIVTQRTCAIAVLNWPVLHEPDRSSWSSIVAVVRTLLDSCLAAGTVGSGGYALELGVDKNLGIFVFQTEDLPSKEKDVNAIAEAAKKCAGTARETGQLPKHRSSCAAAKPPAQCNTGAPSGRSVGCCTNSGNCCEGYGCVYQKFTNAAVTFGTALIGNIGSCLSS